MFREGVNNLKLDKKDFEEAGVRSVSGGALEEELNPLTGEQKSLKGNYINKVDNELEKSEEEIIGQKLEKIGFFEKTKEGLSFDVDKINSFKMMNNQKGLYVYSGKKGYLNREDIFKFLNNQVGFVQGDPEKKIKPFFSLPLDLKQAKKGVVEDGHCLPWDVFGYPYFKGQVKLPSGESISLPDMFYLVKMREIGLHRNNAGELVYYDGDTGKLKNFHARNAHHIFGRTVSLKENGAKISLEDTPDIFIKNYLPLIDSLNIFKEGDFRRMSTTKSFDQFLSHDRKFNLNGPSYYNSAVNEVDIRYYLGRKNIAGTDKKIEDDMFLRDLSSETVGIVQDEHNRKKILYTFNKMSEKELEDAGAFRNEKGYSLIGIDEMAKRIKQYKITDFLPRHKEESPEDYANRLSNLSDVNFVTDKFRNLVGKTSVPLSAFSWSEQLMIANYSLSGRKAEDLLKFSSLYGVNGLKAFLAAERDISAGDMIMNIGFKLEIEKASAVFSKVSELGMLANKEKEELSALILNDKKDGTAVDGVYGKLMDVVIQVLADFQKAMKDTKKTDLNINNLIDKLQNIKADNALLAAVLKSAKEDGQVISLEMLKNINLEKKEISSDKNIGLSEDDKKELLKIAQENYKNLFLQQGSNYNPAAYKRVTDDFAKELNNLEGQIVYILKYKNEVIGFNRFKPLSPYEMYAGSFNISKDIQGLSIGNSFLSKTLGDISESYDIHAKTRQDNPANSSYLKQGFVIVGEHQENDGVSYYDIIKPSKASREKVA